MRTAFRRLSHALPTSPLGLAWLQGLTLVLVCWLVFGGALSGGFIWDDDEHITANPCIVGPQSFWDIWSSRHARIGPLTITSFYLQYSLWGLNPFAFHAITLLFHIGNSVLLWRLLLRLRVSAAWFAALLWALHPVQVESVAWITELKNTQSGLFYLLSLTFFIGHLQNPNGRLHYAASVLTAFLAMASKSSTVVLPLMLILFAWWEKVKWNRQLLWKLVPFLLLSLASAAVSIWTQGIEGGLNSPVERSPLERVAVSGMVFWFYLSNLVWPANLMFIYPRWTSTVQSILTWLPLLAMLFVMLAAYSLRHGKGRGLSFATFAYFIPLLPVLGLIEHYFLRYSAVGDHFQYLASMAILTLFAAVVSHFSHKYVRSAFPGGIFLSGIALVLAQQSHDRVPVFKTNQSLWEDAYRRNPTSGIVLTNLAALLDAEGKLNEAYELQKRALIDSPKDVIALYNLGIFEGRLGRYEEAIRLLKAAAKEKPNDSGILANLGAAQRGAGDLEEAIDNLRRSWKINQDNPIALYNLSEILIYRGEFEETITLLENWLELHPEDSKARQMLVIALRHRR